MAGPMTGAQSGVHLRNISKAFAVGAARVQVLDNLSLDIAKGEFVSLIGPSGCGKSTLVNIVAGLLDADSGTLRINGQSVREAARNKSIGLVPQSPALLPWRTLIENVRLPLSLNPGGNRGRVLGDPHALLASFGLASAIHRTPAQVSRGMQQRAAIARAFVFGPDILLMDEPFSALDEINRDQQRMGLLQFWQTHRTSVLFVTHSVPEAIILSDRIVLMSTHPGQIADIFEVPLPRPRTEAMYAGDIFRALEGDIRNALRRLMESADVI